jgi:hypothetical protein
MMQPQPASAIDFNVLIQRIRRLLTLDTSVFEEVRTDRSATIPAIVVAAAATLLFGLGGWLWWVLQDIPDSGDIFIKSVILGSIAAIVLWGISVAVTYVVLTQLVRARVDVNELVRVMGFAAAPLGVGVLMFIPAIEFGVALTAVALFFGATVIAVQTATDAAPGRVLAACGAGFLVWAVALGLLVGDSDAYAPGIFVFDVGVEFLKAVGNLNSTF